MENILRMFHGRMDSLCYVDFPFHDDDGEVVWAAPRCGAQVGIGAWMVWGEARSLNKADTARGRRAPLSNL